MAEVRTQRRLAAILAADVVGYSRLMEQDEAGTLATLKQRRREILQPLVADHCGRIVKFMGDGVLVEFGSAVNAVACAAELQKKIAAANDGLTDGRHVLLRIGINLGDVVVEGADIYGDGVIIAVRLQAMAEPGGICLSASVRDQIGTKLPLAFKDLGACEVKNISKPIQAFRVAVAPQIPKEPAAGRQPLPTKPSVAVLPFVNMSGDPQQEYFADGLSEDIITALSRISDLFVIARTSTFTYKGQPPDVKRVAQELGVRYVMEGSVRRAGDRLRVTAQLIDSATGHHVWAERYDRTVADVFDIQDEITRSVAASTVMQIVFAEREAGKQRPPADLTALDLVMRGIALEHKWTSEAIAEASSLAEEAIRIDPTYARAHLLRALVFQDRLIMGDVPHDTANIDRGLELAESVVRLAPQDERSHWVMALAYARSGRLDDAVTACERGLALNPNFSNCLTEMGYFLSHIGRTEEAIEASQLALRLNPRDPANIWCYCAIAAAHFVAEDYEAALKEAEKLARWRPDFLRGLILWAAAAAALNRLDKARDAVARCLAQRSDLRMSNVVPQFWLRFARDADHHRFLEMLRKAGLPE